VRTVGIDLATTPKNTGVCVLDWTPRAATASFPSAGDNDDLVELAAVADKVGVDCPFGWPIPFVTAIDAWSRGETFPATAVGELRNRRTDVATHGYLLARWQVSRYPLSVSTDRIGVTAMRCARLLDRIAAVTGEPVDRAGGGRLVEVYPAAATVCWNLLPTDRPLPAAEERTGILLGRLFHGAPWLCTPSEIRAVCLASEHRRDALLAALVAAAALARQTAPPETAEDRRAAGIEGWIHLPTGAVGTLLDSVNAVANPAAGSAD